MLIYDTIASWLILIKLSVWAESRDKSASSLPLVTYTQVSSCA